MIPHTFTFAPTSIILIVNLGDRRIHVHRSDHSCDETILPDWRFARVQPKPAPRAGSYDGFLAQ
jgi:hypothetical protein